MKNLNPCIALVLILIACIEGQVWDFAFSFANDDTFSIDTQNLIAGPEGAHFIIREHSWLIHVSSAGAVLHSLQLTHSLSTIDFRGIAPFTNGVELWGYGWLGRTESFIFSATRADLIINFNRILENTHIYCAASDSAGKVYFGA